METYFSKFPIIEYANNNIRDLSKRVKLGNNIREIPTAFYPYDITNNMRSDVIAYTYYNDADTDWLIYLTNGIVDPYYGWYLNDEEFHNYITLKYGDLEIPKQTIAYWITNWTDAETNVTPSFYNRLPALLQKYWSPVWGPKQAIISYKRRRENWVTNTNKILLVEVSNTTPFAVDDLVQTANSAGYVVGTGEVFGIEANLNILQIGNVLNDWEDSAVTLQVRNTPLANSSLVEIRPHCINITDEETVYWTPIYQFDYERELNESRKTIILLDQGYLRDAARGVAAKLKEE